ncbi:MAG: hypothetical protein H7Y60_04155 [Rhodospirillaceae bacterium]|nr:hypothetical protein [Rhodospirillales bacterium]
MVDRCQGCSKPIHPIKLVRTRKRFECPSCGHNLARQEVQPARDINYQQRLLTIAEDGHIDHPGMERMASVDWFNLLRSTVRLLSTRSAAAKLRRVVATADERFAPLLELPPGFNVDIVPPGERYRLLSAAMWLLESWPHRFFAVSRAAGVPQMQLDNIWPYRVGNSTFQAINRKTAIVSPE